MNGLVKVALAGDGLGDYIFGLDPQLLVDSAIMGAVDDLFQLHTLGGNDRTFAVPLDRKSTRLNSSHLLPSRMPSSA